MAKQSKIFNHRGRKLFRTRISNGETVFGAAFVLFLLAAGVWFALQKDAYDPAERDITMAAMVEAATKDTLYRTPLQRWEDPAQRRQGASTVPSIGVFPAAILEGGWEPASRVQGFTADNLFEKINGAAPQYIRYGFERLHFLALRQAEAGVEISIELYDMGAAAHAIGIAFSQRDAEAVLSRSGDARYLTTAIGAIGIIDNYYFKISADRESPEATAKAQQLVEVFAALTGRRGDTPRPYSVMTEALGVPFEAVSYAKYDAFQFSYASDFWFGAPDGPLGMRYYVHEAEDIEAARALLSQMQEGFLLDSTIVEQGDGRTVFKHNFLGTLLSLTHDGPVVYGIDGAADEDALEAAETRLAEALFQDESASEGAYEEG